MTGPGGKSSRRPPSRAVSDDEVAILAAPWPLLPNGEYTGTAIRVETGFLPGASRKPRVGQAERRQEWRLFTHVRLEQAASPDGHAALERHRQELGELPVTYYVCRFEKARGGQPVRPHPSSKLYRLLCLVMGARVLGEVRFSAVVGRRFRLTLRTSDSDRDGDKKPRELWHSIVDKLLEVYRPQTAREPRTSHQEPRTKYQEPRTNNQPDSTDSRQTQELRDASSAAGPASRRRATQAGKQPTAPAQVPAMVLAGADAEPVFVEVDPWTP